MLTTLYILIACNSVLSPSDSDFQFDSNNSDKMDWELYQPSPEVRVPIGQELTWSAPPEMVPVLQAALEDWNLHLSCGLNIRRVESDGDLRFSCSAPRVLSPYHADEMGWDGDNVITISERWCENLPEVFARHAWGHQLGFPEKFEWYPTVTSSVDVQAITMGMKPIGWNPVEVDGLRVYALNRGAPGCGERELPWSWEVDSRLYHSHPSLKEINKILGR